MSGGAMARLGAAKIFSSLGTGQGTFGLLSMPWLETAAAPLPRAPRACHAPTWRRLMRSPAWPQAGLLAFETGYLPRDAGNGRVLGGFVRIFHGAAPARRGGGCGGTRSRQRDLPARLTLPHNQGRKVDGPSFAIYPHCSPLRCRRGSATLDPIGRRK